MNELCAQSSHNRTRADNEGQLILVDKPLGISSFDVIRILRKQLGVQKMGHAGTLDPRASGLLVVGVGKATKQLTNIVGCSKVYEVTAQIGQRRDTGDMEGRIVEESSVAHITDGDIQAAAKALQGTHDLHVPLYSAVKTEGEPLYKKARRNEVVETPLKEMTVHDIEVVSIMRDTTLKVAMILTVSSGSYVRTLIEAFGRIMGVPATTSELRRTYVGDFKISDACLLDPTLIVHYQHRK